MSGRLLPQSTDAERGLAGSALVVGAQDYVFSKAAEHGVSAASFAIGANRIIWETAYKLWSDRKPVDCITVTQAIRDEGRLEDVGGAVGVMDAFDFPTAANAGVYAEIVKEKEQKRDLIALCNQTLSDAWDDGSKVSDLLAKSAGKLAMIAQGSNRKVARSLKQMLVSKIERMQRMNPDEDLLITGIAKLDKNSPLRRGDMPIIAGEHKSGKSILAMTIAANFLRQNLAVGYFSLEMTADQQIDRLVHGEAKVPTNHDHIERMDLDEPAKITKASEALVNARFELRDDIYDLTGICAAARGMKARWTDLAAIGVDYAQLVRVPMRGDETREQAVAMVSRTLRLLGMELGCAVILLSQLNAKGETRESKALEQDMTAMWKLMFVEDESGVRKIDIPRQRNGESGIHFEVAFHGRIARVEDLKD